MSRLVGKKVLLIVSGGIAAYKAPLVVRAFKALGAQVRVVLTHAAEQFVAPFALQVVSEETVGRASIDPVFESEIGHIDLARWADAILIAPATAHFIARMRAGLADDLATTLLLATRAPIVLSPSMNTQMLTHPATQENLGVLRDRSVTIVDPDAGELACKEVGAGRMPDPDVLVAWTERALSAHPLAGRHVTVTAGPTREHIDPVRFLSNPSSGKMGVAVAEAAWMAGAEVTLIHGPVPVAPRHPAQLVPVTSARDMQAAVHGYARDILVKAAAVADYRPTDVYDQKQKKRPGDWSLTLTRNPDILLGLTEREDRPRVTIGFAAETQDLIENATSKLERKGLDGIVGNSVAGADGAFGNASNRVVLLDRHGGATWVGPAPKREIGDAIVAWIAELDRA